MPNSKIIKRVFASSLLFLLSVTLSVILLEYLIRLTLPVYDPAGMIEYHVNSDGVPLAPRDFSGRQWKNTGDYDVSIEINRFGFRDRKDITMSRKRDIFVVGGSYSIGHGVEENNRYSNLLESAIRNPVYNISIPTDFDGYDKLVKYAKENGATIHNLIIGVCMENDLVDYYNSGASRNPSETDGEKTLSRYKSYLKRHSAAYNAVSAFIHQNRLLKSVAERLGLIIGNLQGINRQLYSNTILESSAKRLVEIIDSNNIPNAIVVIIPSRALWIGGNESVQSHIHDEFVDLLKKEGLKVIDLRSAFEAHGSPLEYHFKNDGHWNNKGHLKASEVIYHYLVSTHKWPLSL